MAEEIEVGTLKIPVEMDFSTFDRQAREDLKRRTDRVAKDMGAAAEATSGWAERLKALAQVAGGAALFGINRLIGGTRGFLGLLGKGARTVIDFTSLGLLAMAKGLRTAAAGSREATGELGALGKAAERTAAAIEALAKVLLTVSGVVSGLQIAVATATASLIILSHRAAAEFAPGWNRVRTILGESRGEVGLLRSEVSGLSAEAGVKAPQATATFYQVLSAMPQLVREPVRALEILRVALEAGSTGFTENAEAADAITAILNAFNLEAEEARRVSDALFAAQDQGVLTFGEVASSIGRVSDLTASLNGRFEDLLGIAATLTPSGTSVAEVFTGVRSAISNVLKPSRDAQEAAKELGVDFSAAALEAKGLNGFLLDIIDTTDGRTDQLARFFGSQEALNLVVSLARQTDVLRQKTDAIANSAGNTARAAETMNDSWERQKELLGGELAGILRQIGFEFEDVGVKGLKAINSIVGAIGDLTRLLLTLDEREPLFDVPGLIDRGLAGVRHRLFGLSDEELEALAQEVGRAAQRRRELEALLFAPPEPAPVAPNRGIVRPEEPISVEFSQQKIDEMRRLREARALADFARTGDFEAYENAVRETAEAVNELVLAEMERLRAAGVQEREVSKLAGLYDVAAERARIFAREGRDLARQVGAIETRVDGVQRAFDVQQLPTFWTEDGPRIISGLDEATRAYERTLLDLREQFARGAIDGETFEKRSAEAAQRFNERLLRHIDHLRSIGQLTPEIAAELIQALKLQADAADDANDRLAEQARTLESLARGVLSTADAMGVLSDETRRAIQGVIDLAGGIGQIASGNVIGGLVQTIGGAIGVISGLFGGSGGDLAAQRAEEHRRTLEANTEAIDRLRRDLDAFAAAIGGTTGAVLGPVQSVLEKFFGEDARKEIQQRMAELEARFLEDFDLSPQERRELEELWASFWNQQTQAAIRQLLGLGFTMSELEELAESFGITLDGTAETWMQLFEAVRDANLADLFAGWAGQMDMLRREFELFDISDPVEQLRRMRDVFLEFVDLPAELEAEIAGLDLTTAAGQERLLEILQSLFREIQSGSFDFAQLGQLTPQEFLDFLSTVTGLLESGTGGLVGGGTAQTRLAVGITEVQANQLLAIESTQLYHLAGIHALLAGGDVPAPTVPQIAPPSAAEAAVARGGTAAAPISISGIHVELSLPAAGGTPGPDALVEAGRAAGTAFGEAAADRIRAAYRGRGGLGPSHVRIDVGGVR